MNDRQLLPYGSVRSAIQIDAVFSPDGRWVAYHHRESITDTATRTFLEPFPATGIKYLVPQNGGHSYWLGKTNQLILNSGQGFSTATSVSVIPRVVFGRSTEFSRVGRTEVPATLARRNVDSMPDGEHVIGVANTGVSTQAQSQIVVVLNWFDEVRQRAPVK